MTAQEAIEKLEALQRQIIHGSNVFGDIANLIRRLELAALAGQDPRAPMPELKGSHPLVIYFRNDADRDEFVEVARLANPQWKTHILK